MLLYYYGMVLLCRPQLTKEALSISASYFSWLSSLTPANQQHKTEKLTGISTYTTLSPPYSLNIWVLFFLVLLLLLSWFVFCSYIVSNHIVHRVLDLLSALIFVITIWTLCTRTVVEVLLTEVVCMFCAQCILSWRTNPLIPLQSVEKY